MDEILAQLSCKNIVDLALLMPKRIENLNFASTYTLNANNCALVEILEQKFAFNKLYCNCYCKNWDLPCQITIFNAKPFHKALFAKGKEVIVYSKVSEYAGIAQFINPKILKNSGNINFIYSIKGVKDEVITKAKKEFINENILKEYKIPKRYIDILLAMCDEESALKYFESEELKHCLKYVELLVHLQELSKVYQNKNLNEKIKTQNIDSWIKTLPFKPTNDQINAINDIKQDLAKTSTKTRIVMGDVGSGKSLVMFAAALMCYPKKVLLMAPTSILATQLYNEAKRLLPGYVKIMLLQKSPSKSMIKQALECNFIIGTHSLLYQDFDDIALVMVDEQQRFSTKQREKLSKANYENIQPHYIEFSATPIPRTTALIHKNIFSYSFIKQMPFKKDIQTILMNVKDSNNLFLHMDEEIKKNNQIIIVYPLIEESKNSIYKPLESVQEFYINRFSNVYSTHGKDKNKEEIMKEFSQNGSVLLSTTIVEVGISLPRLSIIVIVAPERYGLSTLHQLRGRVGRNGVKSYCYLLSKNEFSNRLCEFANTLDGFEIAQIDLKNRKSGDLIEGQNQHGEQFKYFDEYSDRAIIEEVLANKL
ncbi:ATP-dependent DNA helicase RecG [Campylobacter canadensis]|uniref:ATP-dependent DNA helicase RecG n=1 Tax=Campylobacter canadensis TaxID=449520 RepID=A0ABS7WU41_9BACT|nr:ATP-dependent DNA helicase RecG [Campylobacter canadensis]MBZ7987544.1 ATP-dependent DNA helicase RecG [Campylobacter canadensis]MBZ7998700.1 ATP-dependent DNA helicase RecG [Campylobacter canadensis]